MPQRPGRIPPYLRERIAPGKITQHHAWELVKLVGHGKLTYDELRFYVMESGLHPHTINSHIQDLLQERVTLEELLHKAAHAFQRRIPYHKVRRAMTAPVGEFFNRIYLELLAAGHRMPYNFVWEKSMERLKMKNPDGTPVYSPEFIRRFYRAYWRHHKLTHSNFSTQRALEATKEPRQRAMLEAKRTQIIKKIVEKRRELQQILKLM